MSQRPEARFRSDLKPLLEKFMPISIENALSSNGLPDLLITKGAIELKCKKAWPARASTPLRVKFEPEQKPWALKWTAHGGNYWLVIKVSREIFIFNATGAQKVGTLTRAEMHEEATAHFLRWPTADEICPYFELG